jgi:hypothetical protein
VSALEETLLWQLKAAKIPAPEREVRVTNGRRWRFDFAWPALMVAAEVEGGVWTRGRHLRGRGFEADCFKYGEAAILGWRVIRVTSSMIRGGEALDLIARALDAARREAGTEARNAL